VRALREGRDVVVQAPTGAGKTYIFDLFLPAVKGQAVFTVPTRALANDKLAEWQAHGWEVGIATGDLAFNLTAKVIVATLETQKGKFLQRLGPRLLVVDEYQMIADPVRGVNYELALALAPPETQLLLLSGSVANPHDIVAWLRRIGRDAVLVAHHERPVPLEEVDLGTLPNKTPSNIRGRWPRLIGNALRADLGPILLFAPRRRAAEELARDIAALPVETPLHLSPEQQQLAGPQLARLLANRVAFHHSGLSYAQRAGLVEPLAKAGQLRAVVATMGLAAGINFSMRSVAITDTRYLAGHFERQVEPDEVLQMFGRAGRRGFDEIGFALITDRPPRLHDGRPRQLRRPAQVDWPTLLAVMHGAAQLGTDPFAAALALNTRLFTSQPVPLGIEHARRTGPMPCGLGVDMERARLAQRGIVEILNSRHEWEPRPLRPPVVKLGDALVFENDTWRPALSLARTLDAIGFGNLCKIHTGPDKRYGREVPLGTRRDDGRIALAPWLRRILKTSLIEDATLQQRVLDQLPALIRRQATPRPTLPGEFAGLVTRGQQLLARLDFSGIEVPGWIDGHGAALRNPPEKEARPLPCRSCPEFEAFCRPTTITASPAHDWRLHDLIAPDGTPTTRGILFSFFHHGEGLAIAAALEDESYPIEELVFDLANLRAGPRFAGDDSPRGGRLGALCQKIYVRADLPGYLEMGVPLAYGAGASEVVRELIEHHTSRTKLLTESLRQGDIERALIEWRSLLRHIVWAPDYDLSRWRELQSAAAALLEKSDFPASVARPASAPK